MGEALRTYCSTLHSLQVIIAHSRCCLQTGCDIGVVNFLSLLGAVRPDACEAVRLQFEIDGERVPFRRILAGELPDLPFDSENILHMMTKLVRDNVSLRKVRIAAAEAPEFIPEAEVDVHLFVSRTIERPCLRLGGTAAGLYVVAKEDKLCVPILFPRLLRQESFPCFLHIIKGP